MNNAGVKKVAMYGGSFNPIHNGHMELAGLFIDRLDLDMVLLIPTATPPHKSGRYMISAEHRFKMCKIAAAGNPNIQVSDIEILRQGKSYTVDTLKELKNIYKDAEIFLLMGADMFLSLETWKNYKEILNLATICTVPRNDSDFKMLLAYDKTLKKSGGKCIIIDKPVVQVSSTQVRNAVSENKSIEKLVPKGVWEYISENCLYRE